MNKDAREVASSALDLEFAAECIRRGAVVSQPFGSNAQYDFLVDNGKSIFRVQVKSASPRGDGRFSVNLTRKLPRNRPGEPGGSSRSVPYEEGVLDCIITRADGVWFFFDEPHTLSADERVYPKPNEREHKGNRGKDRWDLLGLAKTWDTGVVEKDSSPGDSTEGS